MLAMLEVAPEGLTVSLPHGLRGTVAPEEVGNRFHTGPFQSGTFCTVYCVLCCLSACHTA
jgi:hypothetical protein